MNKVILYYLSKIYCYLYLYIKYFFIELFNRNTIIVNSTSIPKCSGFVPKFISNIGDDLNQIIPEIITNKIVIPYKFSLIGRFLNKKANVLFIGSIITALSNSKSVIIGSGLSPDFTSDSFVAPNKVLRVRGPLTQEYLIKMGIPCPSVYGDPALVLPCIYKPNKVKSYKVGFIPHFLDKDLGVLKMLPKCDDCIIIDPTDYKSWTSFIDDLCSCEVIFSSSLHGLIIADAYNIPNIWTEFVFKVNKFKYNDYFHSVSRELHEPYIFDFNVNINELISMKECYKPIKMDIDVLFDQIKYEMLNLS